MRKRAGSCTREGTALGAVVHVEDIVCGRTFPECRYGVSQCLVEWRVPSGCGDSCFGRRPEESGTNELYFVCYISSGYFQERMVQCA